MAGWTDEELWALKRAWEIYDGQVQLLCEFEFSIFKGRTYPALKSKSYDLKDWKPPKGTKKLILQAESKPAEIAKKVLSRCNKARSRSKTPEYFLDKVDPEFEPEPEQSDAEKYDRKQLERHIAEISRKKTFFDVMGDAILKAVAKLPPPEIPPLPQFTSAENLDDEEWVLCISDVQAGTSTGDLGGLNRFNTVELVKEIDYLASSIEDIISYHTNRPRTLRVFFLGDLIEGSTIYYGQGRAIDMTAVQQVIFSVEKFSFFLNRMTAIFPEVKAYGVIGNHGRIGKKGETHIMDNLDYLAYRWMQQRLEINPRISFQPSESWFQLVDVSGWKFLLVHGDDIRAWNQIPFYGALRAERRWAKLFKDLIPKGIEAPADWIPPDFDFINIGHHHQPAHFSNIIMNGCWPGGSELSLKVMNEGGLPIQKMWGVHPKRGLSWMRQVQLREPEFPDIKVYS